MSDSSHQETTPVTALSSGRRLSGGICFLIEIKGRIRQIDPK